ncbi:hypothetical protein B6I21_08415 [candidate division KSB1 bacterium 4572_119]|nr:MAG: hypothetical protein B6I21_08415 [candidate division KSB1 bacterium 4572_119]
MNKSKPDHCLNCGEKLRGEFCHHCGQQNKTTDATLRQLLRDVLGDFFAFDSKFFNSIVPLLIRPGFLSNEYSAGKRIRYVSPFRLYLFISFFFFLVLATNPHQAKIIKFTSDPVALSDSASVADSTMENSGNSKNDSTQQTATAIPDSLHKDAGAGEITKAINKAEQKADLVRQKIFDYMPNMFFLLLPVFALILKILYTRRKILYVNHFIFSLHFHSFTFLTFGLVFIILGFFDDPESSILPGIVLLINSIYLIFAMKKVYQQSLIKTIIKFILLSLNYVIVMAVSLLAVIGIAIYLL